MVCSISISLARYFPCNNTIKSKLRSRSNLKEYTQTHTMVVGGSCSKSEKIIEFETECEYNLYTHTEIYRRKGISIARLSVLHLNDDFSSNFVTPFQITYNGTQKKVVHDGHLAITLDIICNKIPEEKEKRTK